MRLCILSDTHRHRHEMLQAVKSSQPLNAVLHAGDETSDVQWLIERVDWPVYGVAGNWDRPTDVFPPDRMLWAFGPAFYLVHGHQYSVKDGLSKLVVRAEAQRANVVVFGHTHQALTAFERGMLFINPGSLAQPRGGTQRTYAVVDIESVPDAAGYEVRVAHWTLQGESLADFTALVELPMGGYLS